jgi:exonuclease III
MKQLQFLTESEKGGNLANLSPSELSNLRETMTQSEAKEWIQRYRKKTMEYGKSEAYSWWQTTLADIAKRRGKQAAEDLRNRMNKIKSGETK